jgi:hypothetical protein
LEVVGKADDLLAIDLAIQAETERATTFRREATALA